MEQVRTAKENFFRRFKPAAGVFMEGGIPITSAPVLEMIRKGKQFMEQGDVNGFEELMLGSEYDALSDDDARILHHSVIAEGGRTVFTLISDICDFDD